MLWDSALQLSWSHRLPSPTSITELMTVVAELKTAKAAAEAGRLSRGQTDRVRTEL